MSTKKYECYTLSFFCDSTIYAPACPFEDELFGILDTFFYILGAKVDS